MKLYEALKEGKRASSNTSGSVPNTAITDNHETDPREKGRDLTQSYDNLKTSPKTLITQPFWTDLGQSVGVTTATQLVWLNQFTGSQTSHQSKLRSNAFFCGSVYHDDDLPVSALVLISVANFKIYS